jgi:hypothetical protein
VGPWSEPEFEGDWRNSTASASFGDDEVTGVEVFESWTLYPDGTMERVADDQFGPDPVVSPLVTAECYTAAMARELAANLIAGADLLDKINAGAFAGPVAKA